MPGVPPKSSLFVKIVHNFEECDNNNNNDIYKVNTIAPSVIKRKRKSANMGKTTKTRLGICAGKSKTTRGA